VWEHTLSVLTYLEEILASLEVDEPSEEIGDPLRVMLVSHLGRFRERFTAHFAESLNTDRSVRAVLFFAALYHDIEKPSTSSVDEGGRIRFFNHDVKGAEVGAKRGQAFNLSNDEIERIHKIIKNHMRFHFFTNRLESDKQAPSRKAIYRFFRDSGEAGIDLVLLGLADLRGTRGAEISRKTWMAALEVAKILLENYWEKRQETVAPPRLLDGNDLMRELNLEPGRIIGHLLEAIREGQATGKINTREDAISFAHEWMVEYQNHSPAP
jgi:putative nucleotidyltransferase with HDIG domain